MTTTPLFGPAWVGWQSYNDFAESVRTKLRFVRAKLSEQFLADVRASCSTRKVTVDKAFWCARLRVKSVALCNRRPPVDVGFVPLATEIRGAAICREGPERDIGSSLDHLVS
jgi:hypothetical protein